MSTGVHINFGSPVNTRIYYRNAGTSLATNIYVSQRMYVGEAENYGAQIEIFKRFSNEWRSFARGPDTLRPDDAATFQPFKQLFSEDDERRTLDPKNTIYSLTRIAYTDTTGAWVTYHCQGVLTLLAPTRLTRPCLLTETNAIRLPDNDKVTLTQPKASE